MPLDPYNDLIRQKFPGLAAKADGNSLKSAIHLFCYECMGMERKLIYACASKQCFLWPHRPRSRARSREHIQEQGSTRGAQAEVGAVQAPTRSSGSDEPQGAHTEGGGHDE